MQLTHYCSCTAPSTPTRWASEDAAKLLTVTAAGSSAFRRSNSWCLQCPGLPRSQFVVEIWACSVQASASKAHEVVSAVRRVFLCAEIHAPNSNPRNANRVKKLEVCRQHAVLGAERDGEWQTRHNVIAHLRALNFW